MAKVITFSPFFPGYHPRKGEQTHFIEMVVKSFAQCGIPTGEFDEYRHFDEEFYETCEPKGHTVRAGHRFSAGEKFSPRVWAGRPYNSQQIIIAPDVEIKSVWNFRTYTAGPIYLEGLTPYDLDLLAKNDGLSKQDFLDWFRYPGPFDGQVICWDEKIKY